tara:strand:+ start:54 stop:1070 length:1017 start_codon:yes stop_codon:yes gene_type:complete
MYTKNDALKKNISNWLILMFFIISIMIIVGGLTRLTDSGLSITEWQLFSGFIPPLNASDWENYFALYKMIPEYKLQNFSMTIDEFKVIFWWEWIHRFLGRLIGISFLLPLVFFTIKIGFRKLINLYFIFFLICFQGFIGWYMVSSGLIDRVDVSHFRLSLHLVIAFIILTLIFWNYLKLCELNLTKDKLNFYFPLAFLTLIFVQISIGAFVSGMDAGKIYNTWPLMGNSYFPDDNKFINLFNFNAFSDPSLVQFMHRNLAYLILFFYFFILFTIYKNKKKSFFNIIRLIGLCLFIQIILGIFTLVYGAQIFLSSMHQISSIFLVSSSVYFYYLNSKSN